MSSRASHTHPRKDNMRWGYTTGTCAAVAARAALLHLLYGSKNKVVEIVLPSAERLKVPIASYSLQGSRATAGVVKDAGDDLDVTQGITVYATVELNKCPGQIELNAGKGVGTVTKPGLAVPVGEAAINPVPRQMIGESVKDILPPEKGVMVTVSIPEGCEVAEKTFNSRLGIEGGISVLGTTGRVKPMSREAYLESLYPQLDQALALGFREVLLTPGNKGVCRAQELQIDTDRVVQTGNFVGEMLDACIEKEVEGVLLFGHLSKLVKLAAGVFNTHSRVADARRETLAVHAALAGATRETVAGIMELNTLEASLPLLRKEGLESVFHTLAEVAAIKCRQRMLDKIKVGMVFYSLDGDIIGYNQEALEMGERWGCPLQ